MNEATTSAQLDSAAGANPYDEALHILCVDDGDMERMILASMLANIGIAHVLHEARSGAQAYAMLRERSFGILITDRRMPDMDGDELCRRVMDEAELGRPYIIMLTSDESMQGLVEGLESGADAYLTKPIEKLELKVRVQAGVRVWRLRNMLEQQNLLAQEALVREQQAKRRMEEDMRAASVLQRQFLPPLTEQVGAANLAHLYRPAAQLSGDMLGYFPIGQHHLAFFLLDVCGHGTASALTSFSASQALRPNPGSDSIAARLDETDGHLIPVPPHEVVAELNRRFIDESDSGWYFTMVYGVLDQRSREAWICQAGHPQPILVPHDGPPETVEGGGMPVGLLSDAEFESQSLSLRAGDRIILYSDGVSEVCNAQGEELGVSGLMSALGATRSRPAIAVVNTVNWLLDSWHGTEEFEDDLSLLALELDELPDHD